MINFIVIASTAISVGFVVLWSLWPWFRQSTEKPKYKVLENDRRFRGPLANGNVAQRPGQNC
jgi:hypothetical protein